MLSAARWRRVGAQPRPGIALAPVHPGHRVEPHSRAADVALQSEAVVLDSGDGSGSYLQPFVYQV